jgi:thiol-disulfide isomerase/thioredoxin
MKRNTIFLFLVFFVLTACQTNKNKVVITGKIVDESPGGIEYTVPLNGICYFGYKESLQPDSLGNYMILIDVNKPCIVEFSKGFKSYGAVIIEPGMNYDISINTLLKEGAFKVRCKNEAGQELYNQFKNRSMIAGGHFELEAREFLKNTDTNNIKQTLKSRKEKEIAGFRNLLEKNIISQDFFHLVKSDREYFYAGALGSVAFINFLSEPAGRNSLNKEQYKNLWKEVFQKNPVTDPDVLRSPWFFYYLQNYLRYEEFIVDSFDIKTLSSLNKNGMIHTHYIQSAKKYLTDPQLEYYFAAYIYYESVNRNYEKELISLLSKFRKDYPESKYTKYLVPLIDEIVEFHKKAEQEFNDKFKFPENYNSFNSLKECLKTFYGKKVYIDTWATWCGPCKDEFKHKKELSELLKSKNIEILYISIDKDDDVQKWKDMIKFYSLEGNHIRANPELINDLRRIYGQEGSLAIPWYMLVDEKGNIIKEHAKSPSQIAELEKQINEF